MPTLASTIRRETRKIRCETDDLCTLVNRDVQLSALIYNGASNAFDSRHKTDTGRDNN